ncbi:MAG TPA: glutamate racemase [Fibrobacteraceae bacterium]|jgi:glutamate racemase|nr:glutamate racemase [Fibrobacter sp.]HOG68234.1 glutamate racemase [Fibrobacteraceae bacterium]HPW94309.1 glutamate racemase [Fibrobacteraceae bacterium]
MIGVFDSGFGGLTILRDLRKALPENDFLYLGDNARSPYGSRSFETIHRYTWQSVSYLLEQGCPLVVLACNTASARALRTIQQKDLVNSPYSGRVLGIIRPTAEEIGFYTKTGHIGIFATPGTVYSESYLLEIRRFFPNIKVSQQACPLWVSLVENGEFDSEGARFFIQRDVNALLEKDPEIDTILLGCTHYPLIADQIREFLPKNIQLVSQGKIVAEKTLDYLKRHPEIDSKLQKSGKTNFLTTDTAEFFKKGAFLFGETAISVKSLTFL